MFVNTLVTICIAAFFGIFAIALYFRFKVVKAYYKLIHHRVEFGRAHIMDRKKLKAEILPRYPEHEQTILTFVNGIRLTFSLASVLITIATICVAILMFMT